MQPLNKELRRAFIIKVANGDGIIDWTWWMLPPFVLLFAAVIVLLVQRKWMLFFAAGTFFARIPLVFLTAPDTYFVLSDAVYRRLRRGGRRGAVCGDET